MEVSNLISLLSGVALFLFGMSLMGDGLKMVAGNKLEMLLYRLTNTPLKGVLLGTGVTAVIQSSSATSVMVVGFVNSGMIKLRQAIGIVLGAILGTSITGWIICLSDLEEGAGWISLLSTTTLTGIISVIGILFRMLSKKTQGIHIGNILLGFAVLMFGMSTMSNSVSYLKENPQFIDLLTKFSNPIIGIIVGILFTCVLQSASASVGILQSLAVTGAVSFATALPIIMGIGVGAALPVLLSSLGASTAGRRTAFVYLIIDILGLIICGTVFYSLNAIFDFTFMNNTMSMAGIALMNTVFRLATVIVLFPFIGVLEKLTEILIPDKTSDDDDDSVKAVHLEDRFLMFPALAIEQCRTYINTMAKKARKSMIYAMENTCEYTDERYKKVIDLEELSDMYEDAIGTYLMQVTKNELDTKQNIEVSKFLHTLSDFERIADHAKNVAILSKEINDKGIVFSDEANHELSVIRQAVKEVLSITIDSFINEDLDLAVKIEPLEEVIDNLCDEMKLHHTDRLQKGVCSWKQGFVFNDLLTSYERVSDHCSNIALAMIELEMEAFNTHEYTRSIEEIKQNSFKEHYKEFDEKYSI
jgi:phosphate:Na+ symporter